MKDYRPTFLSALSRNLVRPKDAELYSYLLSYHVSHCTSCWNCWRKDYDFTAFQPWHPQYTWQCRTTFLDSPDTRLKMWARAPGTRSCGIACTHKCFKDLSRRREHKRPGRYCH